MPAEESRLGPSTPLFESVPLPMPPPGQLTLSLIEQALREWVTSPWLRALADASGWNWPSCADTGDLLTRLAVLSESWDFRRGRRGIERSFTSSAQVKVHERIIPHDLVAAAAQVLGPGALRRDGLATGPIAVLGAHRKLMDYEVRLAMELGLGR
jgi:hypothetical protein